MEDTETKIGVIQRKRKIREEGDRRAKRRGTRGKEREKEDRE